MDLCRNDTFVDWRVGAHAHDQQRDHQTHSGVGNGHDVGGVVFDGQFGKCADSHCRGCHVSVLGHNPAIPADRVIGIAVADACVGPYPGFASSGRVKNVPGTALTIFGISTTFCAELGTFHETHTLDK